MAIVELSLDFRDRSDLGNLLSFTRSWEILVEHFRSRPADQYAPPYAGLSSV
jgi:hypothetical protein